MNKIIFSIFIVLLSSLSLYAQFDLDSIQEFINLDNIATQSEDFTIWSALFGLGAVAIIAVFLFSEQLKNFKLYVKNKQKKEKTIQDAQNQILSEMSENIQHIIQETAQSAEKLATKKDEIDDNTIDKVINSKDQLLVISTNLIEFLRIKSNKNEIENEKLKLSNLLNDITGILQTSTNKSNFELIYDVKANVPEIIIGDTLNLSKIIVNLLLYCIDNNSREIVLQISRNSLFDKQENLYFTIISDIKKDVENSENIFNSNYDEKTQSYESLGLFIASELSQLMNGELIARNNKHGYVEFLFNIPFIKQKQLPKKESALGSKKIVIIDSSAKSADTLKEILTELKHKAKIISKENYLLKGVEFNEYDIVLIDENLLIKKTVNALEKTDTKVILLNNIFKGQKEFNNNKITTTQLSKPLTKIDLNKTIESLYIQKQQTTDINIDTKDTFNKLLIHRKIFQETKNITLASFANFGEINILLVEDNLTNQKVLIGVLSKSKAIITVANNGQEALDILFSNNIKFDLVLMDINMPIMDGYIATNKIRTNKQYDMLPIIALTALTSLAEIDKMFHSGMNGYLAKPLNKERLYTAMDIFINHKKDNSIINEEIEEEIQKLDGLDIKKGMQLSNANDIFYKEILSEFKDAYKDSDKIFEKLVNDFRYEQLRILCVDIRGLSGSIGADEVHSITTEVLQRLMYKKYDMIPDFTKKYTDALKQLIDSIDKYLYS
jgi:CheY-like chemotaxis protein